MNTQFLRQGQLLKFELDENVQLVIIGAKSVDLMSLADPAELANLKAKMHQAPDGRFVGVHLAGHKTRAIVEHRKTDAEGRVSVVAREEDVYLPAQVIPFRILLDEQGGQHLRIPAPNGTAVNVAFTVESLRTIDSADLGDLPGYRRATSDQNFDPNRRRVR